MPQPLAIVEIIGRSEQGMTRPFLCRGEDDHLYFVKGRAASARSLICEWLGGHLAQAFGLPIPPFTVAEVSPDLLDLHPEGRDLGPLPLFASRKMDHTQEFTISHLGDVDATLQRDILVFDWWIGNGDRTLTTLSGNPNLLWDTDAHRLVVIDHNLAFDGELDEATFSATHVFSGQIPYLNQDLIEPELYRQKIAQVLEIWPEACNTVPPEWWFADEEQTVPTAFDATAALDLLNRYASEDFLRLTP